ncbi:carboxypeptidase-like regulatory domain-containing protein, partial [Klebsiella pneumoniae]
ISGGSPWTYKSAQTGADGGYSVSGLPAGEYEVQASVFMGSYSDQTATLDLTADSELNFRLVKGGTISGKISGGDGSEVSIELLKADTLEMQDV